jgi:hypothetical protein
LMFTPASSQATAALWRRVCTGMLGIEVVFDHVSLLLRSLRSKGRTRRRCWHRRFRGHTSPPDTVVGR